jgi:hypothetical protein
MGTQESGPCLRYVRRKLETASLCTSICSSSRMTVSGLNRPCAVRKEGSVSQLASTECESFDLDSFLTRGVNEFRNIL